MSLEHAERRNGYRLHGIMEELGVWANKTYKGETNFDRGELGPVWAAPSKARSYTSSYSIRSNQCTQRDESMTLNVTTRRVDILRGHGKPLCVSEKRNGKIKHHGG